MEDARAESKNSAVPEFSFPSNSFLQSRAWEKFQNSLGNKTRRIENTLLVRHSLPARFNYLYCPRPDFSKEEEEEFFKKARKAGREENSIFLKIDPGRDLPHEEKFVFSTSIQPRENAVLDLSQEEGPLVSAMREKTRYNVKVAERSGVVFEKGEEESLGDFLRLMKETASRQEFRPHSAVHYEKLFETRDEEFYNGIFTARMNGEILAAIMVNFYAPSRVATYLHGASSGSYRNVMAPHLIHWRTAQYAKKLGFLFYDLGGTDEVRWPGLTRFKRGFGGAIVQRPESIDIIYRSLGYRLYRLARRLR